MQIHELNNYSGSLNSGAYLAVDNGSDTGKVSAPQIVADTNNEIRRVESDLSARIDNIIAGGDAPSEAEIIDARRGANGTNYSSLGDAIRGQDGDLTDNLIFANSVATVGEGPIPTLNGYWSTANGIYNPDGSSLNATKKFVVCPGDAISYDTSVITGTVYIDYWDKDNQFIQSGGWTAPAGAYYAALDFSASLGLTSVNIAISNSLSDPDRDQILNIYNSMEWNPLAATLVSGKLLTAQGALEDIASTSWLVSDEIDISSYPAIKVKASTGYTHSYYAIYDENHNYMSSVVSPGGGATTYEDIILLPAGAHYARFSKFGTNEAYIAILGNNTSLKWIGKKWACVGDSLTEANEKTTKNYHDYVAEKTGITVVNMGVSGTGYAKRQDVNQAFYQRITSVPADADVITIFGSWNDLDSGLPIGSVNDSGTTTIAGCINKTLDNLQATITLANVGIVSPTPWITTQPSTSGNAYDYVEMLRSICEHRSIPFLDLWRCSNLRPWDADFRAAAYSHDGGGGVHPDENGHKLIAPHFEGFLDSLLLA